MLPDVYETAQEKIRVSIVARGLRWPWSLLILPDGEMLVSLRYDGEVRAIRNGVLDPMPVGGLPDMRRLLDLAMHPKFADNRWIYFGYAKPIDEKQTAMTLARARYEAGRFTNVQDLYVGNPTPAGGSRIAFAPDGTVYMTISGAAQAPPRPGDAVAGPRRLDTIFGKVIRLRDDGTVPPDNPFVGRAGARPEIYSMGHRDHFGLAPHPTTGQMFEAELGPIGGDKINVLKAGGDYGWPDYGYGRHNDSSPMGNPFTPGIEQALLVWLPGITPSGLLFYTGDRFPAWKGNLMVCSTVRGRFKESHRGRTRRVQRQDVGDPARDVPVPAQAADARYPSRTRRADLPSDRRRERRRPESRAGLAESTGHRLKIRLKQGRGAAGWPAGGWIPRKSHEHAVGRETKESPRPSPRQRACMPPPGETCHCRPSGGNAVTYTGDVPDSDELNAIQRASGEKCGSSFTNGGLRSGSAGGSTRISVVGRPKTNAR
jgi:glucose/arabinose dehydrogenase